MSFFKAPIFTLALAAFAAAPAGAVVRDANAASDPITFSDAAVATAFDHCGNADLCATIDYNDGDRLSLFSEGAAYCQPYIIHFVRVHGPTTIYEFSRTLNHDAVRQNAFGGISCGNNQATKLTLDRGLVHLTVDEYTDGTLRFFFSKTGENRKQTS